MLPNPFNPFGPTRPEQFAGRSAEITALKGRLKSTIDGLPQHTAIMGERGIGKISLLRKFEEIARDQNCIIARVDLYPGIRDVGDLLVHLHQELRKSCVAFYGPLGRRFETVVNFLENYSVTLPLIGGGVEKTQQRSLETSFRDRLLTIWSKVSGKAPAIVIMIDEAEKLAQIEGALEYLRNTFPRLGEQQALYCIVICGKTGLFQIVAELFSPLERFFQPITLTALSGAEVFEILEKPTALGGIGFDDRVKQEIAVESEGQPYVVQVFGYCAHDEAARAQTRSITRDLLKKARPQIYSMLENQLFRRRIVEGIGRSKHKLRIMRKLAHSRKDAHSYTEIMKLTAVRKTEGLGSYLTDLVNAGCLRKDPSNNSYSFFIKLFKRYAAKNLGQAEVA